MGGACMLQRLRLGEKNAEDQLLSAEQFRVSTETGNFEHPRLVCPVNQTQAQINLSAKGKIKENHLSGKANGIAPDGVLYPRIGLSLVKVEGARDIPEEWKTPFAE